MQVKSLSSSRGFLCQVRSCAAFTLIELLIVTAIIAILAAIATPNFLEAQVRAKVSKSRADMRTMATAVESYCVDYNDYPLTAGLRKTTGQVEFPLQTVPGMNYENIWAAPVLTTPIAYIVAQPLDLFSTSTSPKPELRYYYFRDFNWMREWYESHGQTLPMGPASHNKAFGAWFLLGAGPDRDRLDISSVSQPQVKMYDPSNGTVSDGDLVACQKTGVFH